MSHITKLNYTSRQQVHVVNSRSILKPRLHQIHVGQPDTSSRIPGAREPFFNRGFKEWQGDQSQRSPVRHKPGINFWPQFQIIGGQLTPWPGLPAYPADTSVPDEQLVSGYKWIQCRREDSFVADTWYTCVWHCVSINWWWWWWWYM